MADQVSDGSGAASSSTIAVPAEPLHLHARRRRWNARLLAGVAIVLLTGLSALTAPWISPYAPEVQDLTARLQGPTTAHWLGTDQFGRDNLSRLLWGGRVSLAVGYLSMFIAISVSVSIGATSGYFGRLTDAVLMRFTELMLVFPAFFLVILIIATFGRSVTLLILVLGFTAWPIGARIIRGEVLKVRARDFVAAAQSVGATNSRIIVRHILPNVASVIIVSATIRVGFLILTEAAVSFLGLGVQPPLSSWGTMVADGAYYIRQTWFLVAISGVAIFTTVMGFNLMGEGLRDLLDPRHGKGRAV